MTASAWVRALSSHDCTLEAWRASTYSSLGPTQTKKSRLSLGEESDLYFLNSPADFSRQSGLKTVDQASRDISTAVYSISREPGCNAIRAGSVSVLQADRSQDFTCLVSDSQT